MDIFVWNKNANKVCIKSGSYCGLSEFLIDFAYSGSSLPPNIEQFCIDTVAGKYDKYFDFSKDFIDIGACHGVYSIELLKKFNHCYSFEANKTYSYLIAANAVSNDVVDRIDIYNEFLSDNNGTIEYNDWVSNRDNNDMLDTTCLSTSCYEALSLHDNLNQYKPVETRTLDSYNFNNIGFIKIDTEGNDLRILQGAVETIKRNNYPPILFKMWPDTLPFIINKEKYKEYCDKLIYFFENLGYKIIYNVNPALDTHLAIH